MIHCIAYKIYHDFALSYVLCYWLASQHRHAKASLSYEITTSYLNAPGTNDLGFCFMTMYAESQMSRNVWNNEGTTAYRR